MLLNKLSEKVLTFHGASNLHENGAFKMHVYDAGNNIIEYAVGRIGSEHILFGTDIYAAGFQRGRVEYALISEEDRANILRENSMRLTAIPSEGRIEDLRRLLQLRKKPMWQSCLGLSPDIEGEESTQTQFAKQLKKIDKKILEEHLYPCYIQYIDYIAQVNSDDKDNLDLPGMQQKLLESLHAIGTPVVLVLANGSPITINWAQDNVSAIIEAWYPGESGGTALADILFGDCSPSGRLPITFVKSTEKLPPFNSYAMLGRTYRYMNDEALYPFGYGLSYTDFEYSNLKTDKISVAPGAGFSLSVDIANIGERKGYEVVQIYKKHMDSSVNQVPIFELIDFRRIMIKPGAKTTCVFDITPRKMGIFPTSLSPTDIAFIRIASRVLYRKCGLICA